MKKFIVLFFAFVASLFFSGSVIAQEKAKTEIASVKQNGKTIDFAVNASKPFIMGDNRYVLHIGEEIFYRYRQSSPGGKGKLIFSIPADSFDSLQEGLGIYLTYGHSSDNEQELENTAKQNYGQCWSLGKFSKDILTK